jgi:CCR4-NOT transcription complex subunit 7/8
VDLDWTRQYGVAAVAAFGLRLRKWPRTGLSRAGVITSRGSYDLAYLVKMMFGTGFRMPGSAAEFDAVVKAVLHCRRVFDVGEMAKLCPREHLRRGLDNVAGQLNAVRFAADAARQASYVSNPGFKEQSRVHLIYTPKKTTHIIIVYRDKCHNITIVLIT